MNPEIVNSKKWRNTRVDSGLSPFFSRTHLLTPGQDLSSGATFFETCVLEDHDPIWL